MSRRETLSPPPPARRRSRGFTLLECEVALLVLTLLAVGLARLTVHHERLVASIEPWLQGDPVYYVERPVSAWERVLGRPATLTDVAPPPPDPAPPPDAFAVTVESVTRALDPPAVQVLVTLVEQP